MKANNQSLLTIAAASASTLIALLTDIYWIHALVASYWYFLIFRKAENKSCLHLMFLVGFTIFIYLAALLNFFFFETSFVLFYLTAPLALLFLEKTKNCDYAPPVKSSSYHLILFIIFSFLLIISSAINIGTEYFLSPLVVFFALSLRLKRIAYNFLLLTIFVSVFLFYIIYGWGGFARTVTLGVFLTGLLCFALANNIYISKLLLSTASVIGLFFTAGRKELDVSNINVNALLNDSSLGPYGFASNLIYDFERQGVDFHGFIEQLIFTALSFIPRAWWPTKPLGFGAKYVHDHLDAYLVDAGHSVAATMIGEHIYYFGYFGFFTAFVIVLTLAWICRATYKFAPLQGLGIILIASNIMVFVWGGMVALSPRIALPLVPMSLVLVLYICITSVRRS